MKKCPFCAEEIQDEAIKCKHCGEFLDRSSRPAEKTPSWYFRPSIIIVALLSVGPLALPLIWFRPNTSRVWKVVITIVTLAFSWLLYRVTMESVRALIDYYRMLNSI